MSHQAELSADGGEGPLLAGVKVAGGMVIQNGRVLLGRRAAHRRICPNTWDLIGGHLEPGETAAQALVREFQEEIGVAPIDFRLLTVLDFSAGAGSPLCYALYRVGALAGPPLVANHEHSELRWFELTTAAALPDLASGHYRSIILEQRLETD